MKYIVRTQGKVFDYKQTAYTVNAENKEEAERIAKERFAKEYILADEEPQAAASGVRFRILAGLVSLSIAAVISFIGFRTGTTRNPSVIRPDLTSLLYAAGIYVILLFKFRGVKNLMKADEWKEIFKSRESIAMAVLMIILIASFIQLMFSQMKIGFSFLSVNMDLRVLALGLALIAYFGSGILSLICLALLLILSKISISGLGAILGNLKGIIFLAAAAVGLFAYVSSQPYLYQAFMNAGTFIRNPAKELRKQQPSK